MGNPGNRIQKESFNFVKILKENIPTLNIKYLTVNINKFLCFKFSVLHFQ